MNKKINIKIYGIVQGVGFRPFVYNLANELGLIGWVRNVGTSVEIEVEGNETKIEQFLEKLKSNAPSISRIDKFEVEEIEFVAKLKKSVNLDAHFNKFKILESAQNDSSNLNLNRLILPDLNVCDDCLTEMNNSNDRRYGYPFINCTNCGPRFSIVTDIPYDRKNTTMAEFKMCKECEKEYNDPSNRRFHAQPTACHVCGPSIKLFDNQGIEMEIDSASTELENLQKQTNSEKIVDKVENESNEGKKELNNKIINKTIELLKSGKILAIKGLGGYHLACDALNEEAVKELRNRKKRDGKPFALMADSLDTIKEFCEVSSHEQELLISIERPIVLLDRRKRDEDKVKTLNINGLIDQKNTDNKKLINLNNLGKTECKIKHKSWEYVASDMDSLGIMLPYTPLQYLLFEDDLKLLVMTSGNVSGEPICYKDEEAFNRLNGIADFFLVHDREIFTRTDDSVYKSFRGKAFPIRRSRGFVPKAVEIELREGINDCAKRECGSDSKTLVDKVEITCGNAVNNVLKSCGNTINSKVGENVSCVDNSVEENKIFLKQQEILAVGGELKSTFCLMKEGKAFLSHHIGDLENLETFAALENGVEHLTNLLDIKPNIIACDLHPDYMSTRYAYDLQKNGNSCNLSKIESDDDRNCQIDEYQQMFSVKLESIIEAYGAILSDNSNNLNSSNSASNSKRSDNSTIFSNSKKIKLIQVQHHHAHIAACMAENGLKGEVIGIALDGTGYGDDGKIWGGEFLISNYNNFERYAHFDYTKLPGGDKAVKEPWRMAVSYLRQADFSEDDIWDLLSKSFKENDEGINRSKLSNENHLLVNQRGDILSIFNKNSFKMLLTQLEKGINCPLTSSAGRLFDGVSAIMGLCYKTEYEGQAAIRLETVARNVKNKLNDFELAKVNEDARKYAFSAQNGAIYLDKVMKEIVKDILNNIDIGTIALKFHISLAKLCVEICEEIRSERGHNRVALSGGVFQNMLLLELVVGMLEDRGFDVYIHSQVPTNDGGIALGQALVAFHRL